MTVAGVSSTRAITGPHMLRARSKTADPIDWRTLQFANHGGISGGLDRLDDPLWSPKLGKRMTEDRPGLTASRSRLWPWRNRACVVCCFLVVLGVVLLILSAYMRSDRLKELVPSPMKSDNVVNHRHVADDPDSGPWTGHLDLELENATTGRPTDDPQITETQPAEKTTSTFTGKSFQYPLVDRSILAKLDRLENFFADDYGLSPPMPTRQRQWPPLITRIPEPQRSSRNSNLRGGRNHDSSKDSLSSADANAICESPAHPRPCRFLLPLRISEQESKARIHLSQIALLVRKLNRTLVLPNVGKSKIGACFKWPFATYYSASSLLSDGFIDQDAYVELEAFKIWWDNREKHGRVSVSSQLISVAPTLPTRDIFREQHLYSNEDVTVHAYSTFGAWERDLPGCVGSKFHLLGPALPVFMSANVVPNKDGSTRPIDNSLIDAFRIVLQRRLRLPDPEMLEQHIISNVDDQEPLEPEVVVVNWDLRHPIFPPTSFDENLQYSARMHGLAERHAPKDPYLVIHWRMETVDPEILEECAHALVDVLTRILHDHSLAENITTVWFASDYPYPIARRTATNRRPIVVAKSGTFKDFEIHHEEAVEVLRNAFDQRGELKDWKLTDFAESLEDARIVDQDLLGDPGVLGILDKLVSIKANLFISGSTRCARKSSFTKQVIDSRRSEWNKDRQSHLRNMVDTFG